MTDNPQKVTILMPRRPARSWRRAAARLLLGLLALAAIVGLAWAAIEAVHHVRRERAIIALAARIDQRIDDRLVAEKIPLLGPADDAQFLRRVYLDLTGTLPTPDAARAFLADTRADKRDRLVRDTIDGRAHARWMANQWTGFLFFGGGLNNNQIDARPLEVWLEKQFAAGRPWDQMAREILTATGRQHLDGRVTPYLSARKPEESAALLSRAFLGVRLSCAQCHDHPYAPFTHKDFWGTAAFFDRVNVYTGYEKFENGEFLRAAKDVAVGANVHVFESAAPPKRPKLDRALDLPPRFLDGQAPNLAPNQTRREAFARWATDAKNPYFAKAMVNRLWWQVFGVGLVGPFDDLRPNNDPSHPELLDELAQAFIASGYDVRLITRALCATRLYRRAGNFEQLAKDSPKTYAGVPVKVLQPAQVFEIYCQIAGVDVTHGHRRVSPGVDIRWDCHVTRGEFIRFFDPRGEPTPQVFKQGIPQLLKLMNDEDLNFGIDRVAAARASTSATPEQVIEEFFLTVYSRRPSADEMKLMLEYVGKTPNDRRAAFRGILWALLNSTEFWIRG